MKARYLLPLLLLIGLSMTGCQKADPTQDAAPPPSPGAVAPPPRTDKPLIKLPASGGQATSPGKGSGALVPQTSTNP